jgi:diguanylate cyclase (GGDEF)-like protein
VRIPTERRTETGRRFDSLLCRLFDWFTGLAPAEAAAFRGDILSTVVLNPAGLMLSAMSVLLMSGTAMVVVDARWATAWFLFDVGALLLRAVPTILYDGRGRAIPPHLARRLVCFAFLICIVFGLGCAACVMVHSLTLTVVATAAMMGLVAGLSNRWAALPRLALPGIALIVTPFCLAVISVGGHGFHAGALQFAVVTAATTALTLQNNRTLIALFRAERRNRLLATTDSLTGLPNRAGLIAALDRLHDQAADGTDAITSLFIDLDDFKSVNDRHGHAVGDRVLVEIAQRLRRVATPHFVCRLGGDEFVVVMESADRAGATFIARHIAEQLAEPIDCGKPGVGLLHTSASVGIAFGSIADRSADQILADADKALYLAKEAGGGQLAIDEPLRVSA